MTPREEVELHLDLGSGNTVGVPCQPDLLILPPRDDPQREILGTPPDPDWASADEARRAVRCIRRAEFDRDSVTTLLRQYELLHYQEGSILFGGIKRSQYRNESIEQFVTTNVVQREAGAPDSVGYHVVSTHKIHPESSRRTHLAAQAIVV